MQVEAEVIAPSSDKLAVRSTHRLLVVDQHLAFVGFARLVARQMGYETAPLFEPRNLATRVREWRPTVLVIEVALPELDGIEITRILCELSFEGQLILVTAHDQGYLNAVGKSAVSKGLRVATCLAKPVRTAEMIRAFQLCEPA